MPKQARVADPVDYPWSSYKAYSAGRQDGITDFHSPYEQPKMRTVPKGQPGNNIRKFKEQE